MKMNKKIMIGLSVITVVVMLTACLVVSSGTDYSSAENNAYLDRAVAYNYDPAYTYNGTPSVSDAAISVAYSGEKTGTQVMNDMARLLGALYRANVNVSQVDPVTNLKFHGKTYDWDPNGTNAGSNWYEHGKESTKANSLVTAVTVAFGTSPALPINLKMTVSDSDVDIQLKNNLTCVIVGSATADSYLYTSVSDALNAGTGRTIILYADIFFSNDTEWDLKGNSLVIASKLYVGFTAANTPTNEEKKLTVTDSTDSPGKIVLAGKLDTTGESPVLSEYGMIYVNGEVAVQKVTGFIGDMDQQPPSKVNASWTVNTLQSMIGLTGGPGTSAARLWHGKVTFESGASLVDTFGNFLTVGGTSPLLTVADKGQVLGSVTFSFPGHYDPVTQFAIRADVQGEVTINKEVPAFSNFGVPYLGDLQLGVSENSQLNINANVTVSSTTASVVDPTKDPISPTYNSGTINIGTGSTITVNGVLTNDGTITNGGTIVIADEGVIINKGIITNNGTVNNNGTLNAYKDSILTNTKDVNNYGTLGIEYVPDFHLTKPVTTLNGGILISYGTTDGSFGNWKEKIVAGTDSSFTYGGTVSAMNIVAKTGTTSVYANVYEGWSLTIDKGATVLVPSDGFLSNEGTVTVNGTLNAANGAKLTNTGTVNNYGTLGIKYVPDFTLTQPVTTLNGGKLVSYSDEFTTVAEKIVAGTDSSFTYGGTVSAMNIVAKTGTTMIDATLYSEWTLTVDNGAVVSLPVGYDLTLSTGLSQVTCDGSGSINVDYGGSIVAGSFVLIGTDGTVVLDESSSAELSIAGEKIQWMIDGDATILADKSLTIADGETLAVYGTLTLAADTLMSTCGGKLTVSDSTGVVGEAGIIGSGTVVVEDGAVLSLGNDSNGSWLVSIDVKVYAGGTMNTFVGPYGSGYAITPTAATTEGYVLAHHNASSGNYWVKADGMTYTIAMDATVNESAAPGTILSNGNAATILSGSTLKVANLTVPVKAVLTVSSGATLDATAGLTLNGQLVVGGNVIGGGAIDFSSDDIAKGSKIITILNGGNVTATLTSGADENLVLKSAVAGEGGITVTKGSIYVDGVLKTGDFVVESGQTVHISGTLDEGATLTILGTGTVVVPENATLTFDEGSALVNETGTISVAASGSSVVYEKGSYINNVVVEVTKKTDSSGTHVSIIITLISEDGNKLVISSDVANEVFSGQTYGDALKGITAIPAKKFITFDGWYILANNEKVSMAQTVLDYDHVLTACFTDERGSPITPDDSSSSETHYIPLSDNGDQIDIALPAAFVMLILSIFVLGFVVVKKRK